MRTAATAPTPAPTPGRAATRAATRRDLPALGRIPAPSRGQHRPHIRRWWRGWTGSRPRPATPPRSSDVAWPVTRSRSAGAVTGYRRVTRRRPRSIAAGNGSPAPRSTTGWRTCLPCLPAGSARPGRGDTPAPLAATVAARGRGLGHRQDGAAGRTGGRVFVRCLARVHRLFGVLARRAGWEVIPPNRDTRACGSRVVVSARVAVAVRR